MGVVEIRSENPKDKSYYHDSTVNIYKEANAVRLITV